MLTRFKFGILLVCAAMGASFAYSYFANGKWAWRIAGIAFAIIGIIIPSSRQWLNADSLIRRLVFGLTAGVMGMGIALGVHELNNTDLNSAIMWFVLAAASLGVFLSVED